MKYYKTVVYGKDNKMPWYPFSDRILYYGLYYCEALRALNEVKKVTLKDSKGYIKTHRYDVVKIEVIE